MTKEEAKAEQDRIAKHFNLGWWYGTRCAKCCGVYPKFETVGMFCEACRYTCPVCGKRTKPCGMPHIAEREWNNGQFEEQQLTLL